MFSTIIKILTLFTLANAGPFPYPQQQQRQLQQSYPAQRNDPTQQGANSNTRLQQPSTLNDEKTNDDVIVDQSPAAASAQSISYMDKDGTTNVLENPSYNPDIYSTFIPQDAIQQYLNYFGGPVPYTAGILPPPQPMAVQTGYEGYIIPVKQQQQEENENSSALMSLIRGIVPRLIIGWLFKFAAIALSTVGLVLFGGALTTAVCALTPLCSISFTAALPALGRSISSNADNESTLNRIRRAAEFLQSAIEKFDELQKNDKSSLLRRFGRKF